jgi:signal transduction histidine kinase
LSLVDLRQKVDALAQGVRRFSQDLRPSVLDHLGLLPAIEGMVKSMEEATRIKATISVKGQPRRLPDEVELVVFRIVQEALSNASRHSQANEVQVSAEFNASVTKVTIQDKGRGFAPPDVMGDLTREGKLGLAGMQERARLIGGELDVVSQPGEGTVITVNVPA